MAGDPFLSDPSKKRKRLNRLTSTSKKADHQLQLLLENQEMMRFQVVLIVKMIIEDQMKMMINVMKIYHQMKNLVMKLQMIKEED